MDTATTTPAATQRPTDRVPFGEKPESDWVMQSLALATVWGETETDGDTLLQEEHIVPAHPQPLHAWAKSSRSEHELNQCTSPLLHAL